MNNMKLQTLVVVIMLIIASSDNCYCFDDGKTHPALTEQVANRDPYINYLKNQLGFSNGLKSTLRDYNIIGWPINKTILEWLQKGSTDEDSPMCRASNHFHNPLLPWDQSNMTDAPWWINSWCANWSPPYSNITWATGYTSRVGTYGPRAKQDMGWKDARDYFYTALTSTDSSTKEDNFIKTFRSFGQVLHLIEDVAVPAHVRNDFQSHLNYNGIKNNSPINPTTWFGNPFEYYVKSNPSLISDAVPDVPQFANPQLTDFWDTDNTGAVPGLAEFTNAGYYSDETIPGNNPSPEHTFPQPQITGMYYCPDKLPGALLPTLYVSRVPCNGPRDHFVAISLMSSQTNKMYVLDDNVHDTYAKDILPKALGYSAALLDHFFRGKIDLQQVTGGITFRSVTVTAQNNTSDESMGIGEARLVIRYKALSETQLSGDKYLLNSPPSGTNISDYTYKVSAPQNVDLTSPQQLTFDFSADTLPYFYDDMTMQLVFKGRLGNEDGAVAVSNLVPIDGVYTDFAVTLPPSGVYAKASDSSSSATFNEIRVTAQTDIPGGLTGGSFQLALEYLEAQTDPFQSQPVNVNPTTGAGYIIRVPENNGVNSLQPGVPVELVFDLSTAPLPVWATDVYVNLIYVDSGTSKPMAIGYRDISEPTPVDIFNNTDYSCIGNQWYVSGTPAARTAADQAGNHNGFDDDMDTWPHDFINIYAKALSANSTDRATTSNFDFLDAGPVAPNTFKRLGYILTDYTFKYSFLKTWVHTSAPQDVWTTNDVASLDTGTGFVNQADKGYGSMYEIRGNKMWWGAGGIFDNLKIPGSSCDWNKLPLP